MGIRKITVKQSAAESIAAIAWYSSLQLKFCKSFLSFILAHKKNDFFLRIVSYYAGSIKKLQPYLSQIFRIFIPLKL